MEELRVESDTDESRREADKNPLPLNLWLDFMFKNTVLLRWEAATPLSHQQGSLSGMGWTQCVRFSNSRSL